MKVCEICGDEIDTKDGENRCERCQDIDRTPKKVKAKRQTRDSVLRDLGLTKVRGALGGTYWE